VKRLSKDLSVGWKLLDKKIAGQVEKLDDY
jgi:hypothetical protein